MADEVPDGACIRTLGAVLVLVALSSGCAFEVQSVGPGNGGLEGDGVFAEVADGGVGANLPELEPPKVELEVTAPITGIEIATPNTGVVTVGPDTGGSTEVVIKEPECTPATEKTSCPDTSCHPETLTCTALGIASRDTCETCFSDSNCADPDHRCVKMSYYGTPFPDERTGFCLKVAQPLTVSVTVTRSYDCAPPFSVPLLNRTSISGGKTQDYCGLYEKLTSCPAVLAFQQAMPCPNGRDDECPEGGLCRELATQDNKAEYLCTHGCDGAADCSDESRKVECTGFCGG